MKQVVVANYDVLLWDLAALAALHSAPGGVLAVDLHILVVPHLVHSSRHVLNQ
jgi:hypothetical protein